MKHDNLENAISLAPYSPEEWDHGPKHQSFIMYNNVLWPKSDKFLHDITQEGRFGAPEFVL